MESEILRVTSGAWECLMRRVIPCQTPCCPFTMALHHMHQNGTNNNNKKHSFSAEMTHHTKVRWPNSVGDQQPPLLLQHAQCNGIILQYKLLWDMFFKICVLIISRGHGKLDNEVFKRKWLLFKQPHQRLGFYRAYKTAEAGGQFINLHRCNLPHSYTHIYGKLKS